MHFQQAKIQAQMEIILPLWVIKQLRPVITHLLLVKIMYQTFSLFQIGYGDDCDASKTVFSVDLYGDVYANDTRLIKQI